MPIPTTVLRNAAGLILIITLVVNGPQSAQANWILRKIQIHGNGPSATVTYHTQGSQDGSDLIAPITMAVKGDASAALRRVRHSIRVTVGGNSRRLSELTVETKLTPPELLVSIPSPRPGELVELSYTHPAVAEATINRLIHLPDPFIAAPDQVLVTDISSIKNLTSETWPIGVTIETNNRQIPSLHRPLKSQARIQTLLDEQQRHIEQKLQIQSKDIPAADRSRPSPVRTTAYLRMKNSVSSVPGQEIGVLISIDGVPAKTISDTAAESFAAGDWILIRQGPMVEVSRRKFETRQKVKVCKGIATYQRQLETTYECTGIEPAVPIEISHSATAGWTLRNSKGVSVPQLPVSLNQKSGVAKVRETIDAQQLLIVRLQSNNGIVHERLYNDLRSIRSSADQLASSPGLSASCQQTLWKIRDDAANLLASQLPGADKRRAALILQLRNVVFSATDTSSLESSASDIRDKLSTLASTVQKDVTVFNQNVLKSTSTCCQ